MIDKPGDQSTIINTAGLIQPGKAAKILGVTTKRIAHELRAGHLAHTQTRPGCVRLVDPRDVDALKAAGPIRMLPTPVGTIADWPDVIGDIR